WWKNHHRGQSAVLGRYVDPRRSVFYTDCLKLNFSRRGKKASQLVLPAMKAAGFQCGEFLSLPAGLAALAEMMGKPDNRWPPVRPTRSAAAGIFHETGVPTSLGLEHWSQCGRS